MIDVSGGGQCVLITGASSGIGRELAFEFARRGYELALVGRDFNALSEVEVACGQLGSKRIHKLSLDLVARDAADRLASWLREQTIAVDILVNNAGFGEQGFFAKTRIEREVDMVELQIVFMLRLVKILLPEMQHRKRGGFLNVASVYSFAPVPRQAVYGACKSFMLSFGEALAAEIEGSGVRVTTVCPGVTKTGFRSRAGMHDKGSGMTAEQVALESVNAFEGGQHILVPGLANKFFVVICRLIPVSWIGRLTKKINHVRGIHKQEDLLNGSHPPGR